MKPYRPLGFLLAVLFTTAAVSAAAFQYKESSQKGLKIAPPWRVHEPIAYSNLSIFPVTGTFGPVGADYLTLDEGLRTGEVEVTELGAALARRRPGAPRPAQAQVNRLALINHSKRPLLLLAGEIVTGGKQDRVVSTDRIVPPGGELPLDVFCIEPGRWSGASLNFNASNLMAAPKIRQKAAVAKNQAEVWAANDAVREGIIVGATSGGRGVVNTEDSRPLISSEAGLVARRALDASSSYAVLEENTELKSAIDTANNRLQRDYEKALKGALKGQKVTGVVIAVNGEVVWADLFAGPELFELYWPKLLRSYVVEAMSVPAREHARASVGTAQSFLYRDDGRQVIVIEPGEFKLVRVDHPRYDIFRLFSLWEKGEPLVHLSKLRKENPQPLSKLRRDPIVQRFQR